MAYTRSGRRPVNPHLASLAAAGLSQTYLVDQGVLPAIDVKDNINGTWIADNPRPYNNVTGMEIVRGQGAPRSQGRKSDPLTDTFNVEVFAHELSIDTQIEPMIDQLDQLDQRYATQAARVVKLSAELRLQSLLFNTGNWANTDATSLPSNTQWNQAGAKPLTDLNAVKSTFHTQAFGEQINTIVLSYDVAIALNASEEVRGYAPSNLGATGGVGSSVFGSANDFAALKGVVGALMGIPANRVFVGSAVQDTANLASAVSKANVWSDQVWMGRVDTGRAIVNSNGTAVSMGPTAAANFEAFSFRAGATNLVHPNYIRKVYAEQANVYKKVDTSMGYLITDVLQ